MKRIYYGRPLPEAAEKIFRREAVGGGCFVRPWMSDWHCAMCRHEWFEADDPAKQELEALLAGIIARADEKETESNNAMEPIPVAATDCADAHSAPSTSMAHLRR